MKKILCVLCILAFLLTCTSCAVNEDQQTIVYEDQQTIVYEDGSYMVVSIQSDDATYETIVEDNPELLPQSNTGSSDDLYQPLSKMIIIDEDGNKSYYGFTENPYFPRYERVILIEKDGKRIPIWFDKNGMPIYDSTVATKNCSYYSADGRLLWTMSLTGIFRENAIDRNCDIISSNITVWEQDSWYVIAEETDNTIDTISYTIRFGRKNLGVTIAESSYTVNLSRDINGFFH